MTPAQLSALKADIAADPVLNAQPQNSDGAFAIAQAYNLTASPNFFVWRTNMPTTEAMDAITWANLTPNAAPDATVTYTNISLACQCRQFNVQTMLMGRAQIDASKAKIRNGLQDALTNIPSGNNGNLRDGGWTALQAAMARQATRAEKLLADASVGNGSTRPLAATLTFEGALSVDDVLQARNS